MPFAQTPVTVELRFTLLPASDISGYIIAWSAADLQVGVNS